MEVLNFWPFRALLQAIQESSIRVENWRPIDIQPIMDHLRGLGPNGSMSMTDLTAKLCWLLGVRGFLRPSDIERIDLSKSQCPAFPDRVNLTVVAPKEKRLGQRIHKEVTIRRHDDPPFCPVATLRTYLERHAHRPCQSPNPVLPHISIHYLIRDVQDCHRPVYSHRISNLIKSIMSLHPTVKHKGRLRTRSLVSTRDLLAGASLDDVVTHGNWSGTAIFNTFYRLSSETNSDFTSLVLGAPGSHSNTLEQQSQDPLSEV